MALFLLLLIALASAELSCFKLAEAEIQIASRAPDFDHFHFLEQISQQCYSISLGCLPQHENSKTNPPTNKTELLSYPHSEWRKPSVNLYYLRHPNQQSIEYLRSHRSFQCVKQIFERMVVTSCGILCIWGEWLFIGCIIMLFPCALIMSLIKDSKK